MSKVYEETKEDFYAGQCATLKAMFDDAVQARDALRAEVSQLTKELGKLKHDYAMLDLGCNAVIKERDEARTRRDYLEKCGRAAIDAGEEIILELRTERDQARQEVSRLTAWQLSARQRVGELTEALTGCIDLIDELTPTHPVSQVLRDAGIARLRELISPEALSRLDAHREPERGSLEWLKQGGDPYDKAAVSQYPRKSDGEGK